jgi:biopolymer transport protein ExbD
MAMTVGQGIEEGEQEVMAAINTTPLVDVMLVLLIIFLITIPVVIQQIPWSCRRSATRSRKPSPRTS